MKKSGSVCVSAFALIFIGSVCTELTPEKIPKFELLPKTRVIDETANKMYAPRIGVKDINAYKTETRWPQTLLKQRRINYSRKSRYPSDQQRRDMSQSFKRWADLSPLIEKRRGIQRFTLNLRFENEGEQSVGFCNYSYNSLDAAMRVYGKDFVFVDKWEVIDGRYRHKIPVLSLFPEGPKWVQAATYSKKYMEAILFMDDKIWVYKLDSVYGQFFHLGIFPNSNKYSHSPECAMVYYDEIYLLKNGTFFRFEPHVKNLVKQGIKTLGGFSIRTRVDAAISSDYDIKFIVKDKVFKLTNEVGVKVIQANKTNPAFNKCT